jgi:hypothetical protein
MSDKDPVMVEGKARWLLEGGIDELDDAERALLLALVSLESDSGRTLTEDEQYALAQIIERTGAESDEITSAVKRMVEAKPKKDQQLDWSDLKKRLNRD